MPRSLRLQLATASCALALACVLTACGGGAPTAQQIASPTPSADTGASSLAITVAELPIANIGQSYTGILTASGSTGAVKWSIVSGALPTGVTLAGDTGAISGTPARSGVFTVAVRAADTVGTVTRNVTIHVSGNGTYYHQYAKPCKYNVKVTKVVAQGKVSTVTQTVTVTGN